MQEVSERIPISEVAKIIGVGEPQVRNLMKRGALPIGQVLSPKMTGKKTYTYYVYRSKLEKYIGKSLTDEI